MRKKEALSALAIEILTLFLYAKSVWLGQLARRAQALTLLLFVAPDFRTRPSLFNLLCPAHMAFVSKYT